MKKIPVYTYVYIHACAYININSQTSRVGDEVNTKINKKTTVCPS